MVDKGVCTKGDTLNTGHGCDTTSSLDTPGQDKVYSDNILIARRGDSTVTHNIRTGTDENGGPICTPHVATISGGSEKFFVVNAAIARIGDAVDAGSLTSGSSKVFSG